MERTEDLLKIVQLYKTHSSSESEQSEQAKRAKERKDREINQSQSQYLHTAQRLSSNIESNDVLVRRMEKLSARKEFSNDPTVEMTECSDLFHRKVAIIQREMESLKRMTEDRVQQVKEMLTL